MYSGEYGKVFQARAVYQKKLEARMRAAEDEETMVQLCNRLHAQHAALTEKLVPESEEVESRTVEFNDMVMHMSQSRMRSQRDKEAKSKVVVVQPATAQGADTMGELTTEASQEAGLQQGPGEPEGAPAQLANNTDCEEVHVQAEEVAKVLDTDTVVRYRCQMQQPMLKHINDYITDQVLPASRPERVRMLEVAPMYEVNKAVGSKAAWAWICRWWCQRNSGGQ